MSDNPRNNGEEWISRYIGYKSPTTLFVSSDEFIDLKKSDNIIIDSVKVPILLLKRILSYTVYFEYVKNYFINKTNNFAVELIHDNMIDSIKFDKSILMKALNELINSGQIVLEPVEQIRYQFLKNCVSYERFKENYQKNIYDIEIDGKKYSIPVNQMILFMQMPIDEFNNICLNSNIKDINGIPKEYFIYAIVDFFKKERIFDNYVMPETIINRYNDFIAYKTVDFEAVNKHLEIVNKKHQEAHLSLDLEKAILSGMPEDATDLEKAIYIYIKMCKLLTYDEEFYAVHQKGEAAEKHKRIEHVSTITLENNEVVCFEFNVIYAVLLDKLGIKFKSEYHDWLLDSYGEAYGGVHVSLEFRTGKFLVTADSVTSILEGDIMQAKLNQPLLGLKCINKNAETQKEFNEALTRMYHLVATQDQSLHNTKKVEHVQTLDELLEEYSHTTQNIQEVSVSEKLSILINKVNSSRMIGIDALSYILQLMRILFTKEQRKNNIRVTIIRNNSPLKEGKFAMASAIFALNIQSFEENQDQSIYYYFNPSEVLTPITREELQSKFDSGVFAYVTKDDPRIPGIVENGGIKNAR